MAMDSQSAEHQMPGAEKQAYSLANQRGSSEPDPGASRAYEVCRYFCISDGAAQVEHH